MSKWTLLVAAALLLANVAVCAEPTATLPPMRFTCDKVGEDVFTHLRQTARFQYLSREVSGSPIELRVHHTFQLSGGGRVSGSVSGLLAAGTLGLLPQVYSGEHSMIYEVVVNGAVLTTYTYRKVFSRAHNLWRADSSAGLGKQGLEWAAATAEQFLQDSAADAKLSNLVAEYSYYFGDNGVISGPHA